MDIVSVYVGLDYHSDAIQVCVMTAEGDVLLNRSVANQVGLVVEAVSGTAVAVIVEGVALEACTGSAEFAARLRAATEWPVRLAHAAAVHRLKQGPDKTDHGDAWHLANLIRVNYLPEVWLADEHTRQLRHLARHRQSLVAVAKDVKLRIRSLLKEDGIAESCPQRPWTKDWLEWLKAAPLPSQSRWIIDEQLRMLDACQEKIAETDRRMEEATRGDRVVKKLLEQAGVGLVTALLLRAVVGRFDRFRNGKQLSRYCGLTPCNASSGRRQADAGLVTAGHDDLRAALIQLAKRLPRQDPHWREFKERLRPQKPANVVSAAIANRWLRRLHHELVSVEKSAAKAA
ncbi:MAG TPA: IS110 family transposase [Verrucomicrobiae bacterium]